MEMEMGLQDELWRLGHLWEAQPRDGCPLSCGNGNENNLTFKDIGFFCQERDLTSYQWPSGGTSKSNLAQLNHFLWL